MLFALRRRKKPRLSSQLHRILYRIRMAAWVLVALMVLGTAGFYLIGGARANFSDALYMTIITVTTVGYGEVVPIHTVWERLFVGFIALSGFGMVTFLFTSLTVFFLETDLDFSMRRRRMESTIKKRKGHYIVCGYGRVGRNVAMELASTDRMYVAIESELSIMKDMIEREPDLLCLHGDATDDEVLLRANIAEAAGVFAVTNDDAKNLMIALTAKQLNPRVRVVARSHEVRNIDKMKKAGADEVVVPDFTGGMRIVSMMVRPHVVSFLEEMRRSEHLVRMEEIPVPMQFEPRPISSLCLRSPDYILVAVRSRKNWTFNPGDDFELAPGHILVAMTSAGGRAELETALV